MDGLRRVFSFGERCGWLRGLGSGNWLEVIPVDWDCTFNGTVYGYEVHVL